MILRTGVWACTFMWRGIEENGGRFFVRRQEVEDRGKSEGKQWCKDLPKPPPLLYSSQHTYLLCSPSFVSQHGTGRRWLLLIARCCCPWFCFGNAHCRLGILLPLGRLLRSRGSQPGGDACDAPTALLLGAGGAAAAASYALAQMQAHLIVWNRTLDKVGSSALCGVWCVVCLSCLVGTLWMWGCFDDGWDTDLR